MIDFGRTIDTTLYNCRDFLGDSHADHFKCIEMRLGLPWREHIDLFGIAASAHLLLYSKNLELQQDVNGDWTPTSKLRRYFQQVLWGNFFREMINIQNPSTVLDRQLAAFEDFASKGQFAQSVRRALAEQETLIDSYTP